MAIHRPVLRLQWIASFLAMTGRGRHDGAGRHDNPVSHCEARSAVVILAMTKRVCADLPQIALRSAASSVLTSSMVMVMGPTPPGTGVM